MPQEDYHYQFSCEIPSPLSKINLSEVGLSSHGFRRGIRHSEQVGSDAPVLPYWATGCSRTCQAVSWKQHGAPHELCHKPSLYIKKHINIHIYTYISDPMHQSQKGFSWGVPSPHELCHKKTIIISSLVKYLHPYLTSTFPRSGSPHMDSTWHSAF